MSLVLNTNASGGGWYEISNDFLDIYPDIKNKIIFNFWNWKAHSSVAITDWPYVASVNWTKINFRWTSVVAPQHYTSVNWNDQWPVFFWYTTVTAWTTVQKRVWLPVRLKWWEVIWKEIIWWRFYCFWYSYRMNTWTFSQKVWLLHTDWTITYIWELNYTITAVQSGDMCSFSVVREGGATISGTCYQPIYSWDSILTWSWVVAQEWDIIICDLTLVISTVNSANTQYATWIFFWFNYTTNDNFRNSFLQISID